MGLEEHYLGDPAFTKYSEAFASEWEAFTQKERLLKVVGAIELARPIAFHFGPHAFDWLQSKVPALDYISPIECLSSQSGIRRLKSCLMRMP